MDKKYTNIFILALLIVALTLVSAADSNKTTNSTTDANYTSFQEPRIGFFPRLRLAFTFNKEKKIERSLELSEAYATRIANLNETNPRKAAILQRKYNRYTAIAQGAYERMQGLNYTNSTPVEIARLARVQARFARHEKLIEARYDRIKEHLELNNATESQLQKFEQFRQRANEKNEEIRQRQQNIQQKIIERKRENIQKRLNQTDNETGDNETEEESQDEENQTKDNNNENESVVIYPPEAPDKLTVSYNPEANYIFLEWKNVQAGEGVGDEDGYKVWKSVNSNEATLLANIEADTTSTTDTDFNRNDTLEYYVVAWNSAGQSASDTVRVNFTE